MKDEVVCADDKTYKEFKPVEFGKDKIYLKGSKCKIISNIKRINVVDYKDIVIIEGRLFVEVKKKEVKKSGS